MAAGGRVERIAAPAVKALDTTGAGDTFNGVLAAGLARGWQLERAAREAVQRRRALGHQARCPLASNPADGSRHPREGAR